MPNPKYDILFEGRYVEGAEPARVRTRVSEIFKIAPEDSRKLFSGRSFVIKKGVDLREAHRFKNLMRKAGAACRLVPQDVVLAGGGEPRSAASRQSPDTDRKNQSPELPHRRKTPAEPAVTAASSGSVKARRSSPGPPPQGRSGPAAVLKQGLVRSRILQLLLIGLAVLAATSFAVPKHGGGPMPTAPDTLESFVSGFNTRLLEVKAGRSRALTHMRVAKAVVEDMGYDYDQTLLAWHFNQALSRDGRRREIGDIYLIGPIETQFELDASQARAVLSPETYDAMEKSLGVGDYITLRSIQLLRECARGEDRVTHEALMEGLAKFDVPVDPQFPEFSVGEAFYGLSYNGLIQIRKRREWKSKRVELEILDRGQIADQERRLTWLEDMYARYTRK